MVATSQLVESPPPSQGSNATCGSGLCESTVTICTPAAATVDVVADAMQTGSTQVAGTNTYGGTVALSVPQLINFIFTVSATDSVTFSGGWVNFP